MATVISFTFREAMADVEYQGYCIPKGWKVLPLFRSIHHNPDFFTDPGKFNPSRFEWEIKGPSCFMENRTFLVIRLISGVIFQFWCSYITFPLYVIVTQVEEVNSLMSELVNPTAEERALLVQCRDHLSILSAMQVPTDQLCTIKVLSE